MNRLFILSLVTMTTFNSFAITAKQGRDLEANYELVEIHEGDEYDCKSNIYIETTLDDSKKNIEQVVLYDNMQYSRYTTFDFSTHNQSESTQENYSVNGERVLTNFDNQPIDISGIEVDHVTQIITRPFSENRLRDKITIFEYETPSNVFIKALAYTIAPFVENESFVLRKCTYKKIRE